MTDFRWTRRRVLGTAAAAGLGGVLLRPGAAPAFVPGGRPVLTHGVQSGDAYGCAANIWTRADRPGRMTVQLSDRPDFRHARTVRGPLLTPDTDLTGRVRVTGIGTRTYYRVTVTPEDGPPSEPLTGTVGIPAPTGDLRFVWTADIAGQGFGINPDLGGMRIFKAMQDLNPDFYLCAGDHIYADNPIEATVVLADGRAWHNVTTDAKSKVAETLAEFRGNFGYNLLDENLRAFLAQVPQLSQWDDHEVHNNWYPGQILADGRYTEKGVDVLAARAKQAFHEWTPISPGPVYRKVSYGPLLDLFKLDMRTFKDPNDANVYTDPARGLLGAEQRAWLIRELLASKATWKVIANDLPLGLVVHDSATVFEGVAQGDPGAPLGRELEFAEVLQTAHRHGVRNLVFLTADVHYTAAHHYDPARAVIQDFTPFWEFVSGPANAGSYGPGTLDMTFGPEAVFRRYPPVAGASPLDGFQHFGEVLIERAGKAMTVNLRDLTGALLWTTTLQPG